LPDLEGHGAVVPQAGPGADAAVRPGDAAPTGPNAGSGGGAAVPRRRLRDADHAGAGPGLEVGAGRRDPDLRAGRDDARPPVLGPGWARGSDPDDVDDLAEGLADRLREHLKDLDERYVAALDALVDLGELRAERAAREEQRRAETLTRIHDALGRLRLLESPE